jgi:hypothetical protein
MAARLRQEAEATTDPIARQRLLELAAQHDRLADQAERESDTKRPRQTEAMPDDDAS